MNIRKYYIDDQPEGGGADSKSTTPPKGYAVTTPQQRTEWNGFLDYLDKQGVAGKSDLDKPGAGLQYFQQYKKANPDVSITPEHIQNIQYEQQQLRNGGTLGNLGKAQMDYMRQGMSDSYLSKPVPAANGQIDRATSGLYYPTAKSADTDHGTDIEGYYNAKMGLAPTVAPVGDITAAAPGKAPKIALPSATAPPSGGTLIPRPDYNNQSSRNNFLQQWAKKYGDLQGRGDTILKLNEVPRGGSNTEEVIATNAAKKFGIDPALLHVSAFEEGASELFKDKSGLDTKHRKPTDFGYMGNYGDKDFPINGNNSFGLPDFTKRFPDLVAGGYLPKDFQSQFRGTKRAGEFGENNFKTPEDAMTAKAALMKFGSDYVEKIAQKNGVELSPKQKDFFTLAWFNGGEGAVLKRIPQYKDKGYLKDDKFLDKRPKEEEGKPDNLDVYGHVVSRIKRRDALVEQQFFQPKK